ncbi:MAG: hypothetical protein HGA55_07625 [Methanoregulaceae archaeon]|nr:hypothetical protein [Methanoregulaceae archaeon]
MKRWKYLLLGLFCLCLVIGTASAVDDLIFSSAKQDIMKSQGPSLVKPLPLQKPGQMLYVGSLPKILHPGDNLNLRIYGTLNKGDRWQISVEKSRFLVTGNEFLFKLSDIMVPADSKDVRLTITGMPVSWLRFEYLEDGIVRSMESSSPDPNGRITLQSSSQYKYDGSNDYAVIEGTSTHQNLLLNQAISGVLMEEIKDPVIPFHIDKLQKGGFTYVVSVNDRVQYRQPVFIL